MGVLIRKSTDGGQTFPTLVTVGTPAAYSPRIFARTSASPATVDCVFLDNDAIGPNLVIFHSDANLQNGTTSALVSAASVPGTTKNLTNGDMCPIATQGGNVVDGMGQFGFDAIDFNGNLYVVAHRSQSVYFQGPMHGRPHGWPRRDHGAHGRDGRRASGGSLPGHDGDAARVRSDRHRTG